jgi:hypothetical protein
MYRVFKETIRSGGAKLTPKHIKDVSCPFPDGSCSED